MTIGPPAGGPGRQDNGVEGVRSVYTDASAPASCSALGAALDYAARGWLVFPCAIAAKTPVCSRGFKEATGNPATIKRWWRAQDYNIAVATGVVSKVWVLDVDGAIGAATLGLLEAQHGALPATLCSATGSGCHLWFVADAPLPSSVGRVGLGLDVRADGGYVLAPPSVHPDGPIYQWIDAMAPAIAPDWLIRLARRRPGAPVIPHAAARRHVGPSDAYGRAALDAEIAALANTAPGGRNHALNRASFSLHQLVAGGELDGAEVQARLIEAATANGLMADPHDGPRAVLATIRSGARAGLAHPRSRREAS